QPVVVWPLAEDLVTGDEPFLLDQTVINFEAIAALQPDLILAINLRLDENEYETLAAIAPTVARPVGTVEAEVPWRLRQEVIGVALGRVEEAAAAIARTEARFAAVREQHPEFAGLEATLANVQESGMVNTYDLGDARYQFLLDLGFDAPEALEGRADDDLFVSLERLDVIDADVVIWSPAPPERLQAIPTRDALMTAAQERREIIIDPIVSVALVEASPLSLQYVIDRILADLALAADGDPDTVAASALELYGLAADVASDEEQAAIDAWVIALGPEASLEEKARHIADFDSILPAVEAAIEAGNAAGGVEVLPQRATINGDLATVLFDVALGGTVAAEDFTADLTLVDGVWVASRSQVCTYVALIGVQCPAE
ncbi:MAG: ABC transporter substrate-binding protein, partial [Actinomycetota bacterium]